MAQTVRPWPRSRGSGYWAGPRRLCVPGTIHQWIGGGRTGDCAGNPLKCV